MRAYGLRGTQFTRDVSWIGRFCVHRCQRLVAADIKHKLTLPNCNQSISFSINVMGPDFLVISNYADGDKLFPSLLSSTTTESAVTSTRYGSLKARLRWVQLSRRLRSPEELDVGPNDACMFDTASSSLLLGAIVHAARLSACEQSRPSQSEAAMLIPPRKEALAEVFALQLGLYCQISPVHQACSVNFVPALPCLQCQVATPWGPFTKPTSCHDKIFVTRLLTCSII